MPTVGYATLQIIPSVRGISDEIRRQLVGPAGDAGQNAGDQAGGKFSDQWKAGLAAAGAAGGALLVASTVSAVAKEKAGDRLAAQLGLSGPAAKRAGDIAGKLYAGAVVDSFEEGAETVRAVMSSGLIPEKATTKSIEAITTSVADLSRTFDQDLTTTANAASQMIRTGLAKDGTQALDQLTRGFQSGANKADDLLETINEYGTQFRKFGLDGSAAIGLLNQAIRGGARDSDVAADAIKEFAIRAVDGSKTTADGFKMLRLSADDMATRFGKGGSVARAALDLTLDRLRALDDPVRQEAAAVALFGTQAEDLGKALYEMDVSTAADSLGKVNGAAKRVGDTIRSNTATELEVLKRQLMSGIGGAVAAVTVPALLGLIDAIRWTGDAAQAVGRWLQDWGIWLAPLAILIGGVTLALSAQAIVAAVATGAFAAYVAVSNGVAAVTRGLAAAQAVLDGVMALNPVVLVVIALVALAAALVIAYKKSETFRAIVQGVWRGIQQAALWAWNNALKPALDGIVTGATAVGRAATWLWGTVLKPVFSAIGVAARVLATIIGVVLVGPWILAFRLLAPVVTWLWETVVRPAFLAVGALAGWLVNKAVKPALSGARTALRLLGAAATWLWQNAVRPAFQGIGVLAGWLYRAGIKPQIDAAKTVLRGLGTAAGGVRDTVSKALHGIATAASWLYDKGLKPPIDKGKVVVNSFAASFKTAKDTISEQWSKLSGIAKKPIAFIVNTVYNAGLVPVWNKIAGAFGAPKLDKASFARGGVLPGYTPGRDPHQFYSPTGGRLALSGGEAIMRPEWTRAVGPGFVHGMNALARRGGVGAVRRAFGGEQRFALGGIIGGGFDWIGKKAGGVGSAAWDAAKKGAGWLADTLEESARAGVRRVVMPLLKKIPGLDTGWGQMVRRVPLAMIDALFGYSKEADKKGASSTFGGGQIPAGQHRAIITRALAAAGVPPPGTMGQWLAGLNTLITRESGWNAAAVNRSDSNARAGHPSQGLAQTIPGTWSAYVPSALRSRGILDPVGNVAAAVRYIVATYGNITNVQQANASRPPKGYASGGSPRPGEIAWVGERGPELIQFRGGEVIYSHPDSLRLAAGLDGAPRGFAMGTIHGLSRSQLRARARTQASARRGIPGDLAVFLKALTGSASTISKAAGDLATDMRRAGTSSRLVAAELRRSAQLQGLANRRDKVAARIAEARNFAADQTSTARDYLGLGNLSEVSTVADLIAGMREQQGTVADVRKQISTLEKRGLSKDLIGQIVAQGPESDLARLVTGAGAGQIKQLNALAASGAKLSTAYGRQMADLMYDSGAQTGRGFLSGLIAQEDALQAQMNKLGRGMVASIKRALKIKSPSRVTKGIGEQVGAGLVVGMAATTGAVQAAAARVAEAAVPASVSASAPAGAGPGLVPGQPVVLCIEDGPTLRGWVEGVADGRVDAGLAAVTRRRRAGTR